jgi:cytochrome c
MTYHPTAKIAIRALMLAGLVYCFWLPYSFFGVLPLFTFSNEFAAEEDSKAAARRGPEPAKPSDDALIGEGKIFASAQELTQARVDWVWCGFCHYTAADAPHRIGPNLNGIIGRRVGSKAKYFYTASFRAAAKDGKVWTEDSIDAFLAEPMRLYPGNRMRYAPITDPEKRKRILKYLKAFS